VFSSKLLGYISVVRFAPRQVGTWGLSKQKSYFPLTSQQVTLWKFTPDKNVPVYQTFTGQNLIPKVILP